MTVSISKRYEADSGHGSGKEKVICILLTSPGDILSKNKNVVLEALNNAGLSNSIGVYFYRFKETTDQFIKIGECTRKEGISVRFKRGWHGTNSYSDTYRVKKKNGVYIDSVFFSEIKKISKENPAYFIFYEHDTLCSHPKIDEIYAYRSHKRLFNRGTLSPERMNSNGLLARKLIWHKKAFCEVARGQFPDGESYCDNVCLDLVETE